MRLLFGIFVGLFYAVVLAHPQEKVAMSEMVKADQCVIQEVIPGKRMTAAFVTFHNMGHDDVMLTGVSIPKLSTRVEMHKMEMANGVMTMQPVKQVLLKQGESVFKKGGYHIMVMNIAKLPKVGDALMMNFRLQNGAKLHCLAKVLSVDEVMRRFANDKMKMGNMKMDHGMMQHGDSHH